MTNLRRFLLWVLIAASLGGAALAQTTNLGLTKPTVGADADAWGGEINADLDLIDAYLAPGQFAGTATNDSAASGKVGEFISSNATGVSLTTATSANVTSISLTAGDWDVAGVVQYIASGGAASSFSSGISSVSGTLPAFTTGGLIEVSAAFTTSLGNFIPFSPVRFSLTTTTTIYMVAQASFASGTMSGGGYLRARRVR